MKKERKKKRRQLLATNFDELSNLNTHVADAPEAAGHGASRGAGTENT